MRSVSSGVGIPYFGEMKGMCLTLAKRQFYKNEFNGKHLEALKWCIQKFDKEFILIKPSPGQSQTSLLKFTKFGVVTPLAQSLNVINCQKRGETPYQNISF